MAAEDVRLFAVRFAALAGWAERPAVLFTERLLELVEGELIVHVEKRVSALEASCAVETRRLAERIRATPAPVDAAPAEQWQTVKGSELREGDVVRFMTEAPVWVRPDGLSVCEIGHDAVIDQDSTFERVSHAPSPAEPGPKAPDLGPLRELVEKWRATTYVEWNDIDDLAEDAAFETLRGCASELTAALDALEAKP